MALKAGRVGVRKDQVDPYGRISTDPYVLPVATAETLGGVKVGSGLSINEGVLSADDELPTYSSAEAGKVLSVDNEGALQFTSFSAGMHLYRKTFDATGNYKVYESANIIRYECNNIAVTGYTPIFCMIKDVNTGYHAYGACLYMNGNNGPLASGILVKGSNVANNNAKFIVYYVKDSEATITDLE